MDSKKPSGFPQISQRSIIFIEGFTFVGTLVPICSVDAGHLVSFSSAVVTLLCLLSCLCDSLGWHKATSSLGDEGVTLLFLLALALIGWFTFIAVSNWLLNDEDDAALLVLAWTCCAPLPSEVDGPLAEGV
jgi:hypothetical protein